MTLNSKTTHLLVVLQQKLHDTEFCVPVQGVYEGGIPSSAVSRYQLVVDGEYYKGERFRHVTREVTDASLTRIPSREIATAFRSHGVCAALKLYRDPTHRFGKPVIRLRIGRLSQKTKPSPGLRRRRQRRN
jgi:hypothetical protein